jgi:hypothetical protein
MNVILPLVHWGGQHFLHLSPAVCNHLLCTPLSLQLGAKKGLGAQKVSSKSFSEVEKQAQVAEKQREEQAADAKKQAEESM